MDDKPKKKRGRKPKVKEVIDESKLVSETKNNIIHLKIKKEETEDINNVNNYDKNDIYYEFKDFKEEKEVKTIYKIKTYPYENVINNNNNQNINCYWCCHPFQSTVFTLPTNIIDNVYHVYGCFCSPECACAYNFNDYGKESYKKWERYSLLNLLYKKIFNNDKLEIVSALPRETLKIFGGNYNIEDFRSYNNNYKKRVELLNYPLVSNDIVQNEIEINTFLDNKDKKIYIPLNQNILEDNTSHLKLKRSKPLNVNYNTLEKCMNLKYN